MNLQISMWSQLRTSVYFFEQDLLVFFLSLLGVLGGPFNRGHSCCSCVWISILSWPWPEAPLCWRPLQKPLPNRPVSGGGHRFVPQRSSSAHGQAGSDQSAGPGEGREEGEGVGWRGAVVCMTSERHWGGTAQHSQH